MNEDRNTEVAQKFTGKAATVYYVKRIVAGKYQIGIPFVRTFSIPMDLIHLDKSWILSVVNVMEDDDKCYFIIDPKDHTKGILLDEFRGLDFNTYAKEALKSKDCPSSIFYGALGLTGEAGEVSDKIKKYWRDYIYMSQRVDDELALMTHDIKDGILKEMGDVLWYLAFLANALNVDLQSVAQGNIRKIQSRVKNGTIHGEGDDR